MSSQRPAWYTAMPAVSDSSSDTSTLKSGQRQLRVSWRRTATVATHGMNSIVTVRKASPAAGATCAAKVAARPLVDASPFAQLLLSPDRRILAASEAYLRLLGLPRERVIGQPLAAVLDAGSLGTAVAASLAHERFDSESYEIVNAPAGDGILLHSLKERSSPVAAALEAAEARLRTILQTVPDAMIVIDEHGLIESLSTTAERLA